MRLFRNEEEKVAYSFLIPALSIIILLIAYPFLFGIYLSFTNARVGSSGVFVGFQNFLRLISSSVFRKVLANSLVFTIGSIALKLIIGISIALLIENLRRGRKFVRGVILLPWVIPTALSVLAWWWMFNPNFSVLNWIIVHLGFSKKGIPWLSRQNYAMLSVILVNVWRGVPFFAISFLAGLVSIGKEFYEAAETEGAKSWQKFFYITLPLLKPVLVIVLLFSTLMTVSEFNIIYILTGGGPMYGTHLLATLAYQEGIGTGDISKGAAISIFLFPILFLASYFQLRIIRQGVKR